MSMNAVSQTEAKEGIAQYVKSSYVNKKSEYGNVIGEPKLSENGQKYYEELKKKYSNMDFVLVGRDSKTGAEAAASGFSKPGRTLVLIDEDKIERMATDKSYREKYEAIIQNGDAQLRQMQSSMNSAGNITSYGMKVQDDGKVSFFAVVDKSLAVQKARIEKKAAEKKAERKEEKKETEKEAAKERLENQRSERKESQEKRTAGKTGTKDLQLVTASSVEELLQKINDINESERSNHVMTEEELMVGTHIDFRG